MYHAPKFEPTRDEMISILEQNIPFLNRTELVSLFSADGRIAAETVYAPYALPNRPVSAIDGIAVRFSDFAHEIPDASCWQKDAEYAFSNTGVAISEDYDTVIAIEDVTCNADGTINIMAAPSKQGEYVQRSGSQFDIDEILVEKGETLQPVSLSLLMAAGYQNILVFSKPTILFLPTGDELIASGNPRVPEGANIETNSLLLSGLIRRFGGTPAVSGILPDDPEILKRMILWGIERADLVIICAGSSKGSKDYTMDVLKEIGAVLVQELGVAPGKHCSLTMVSGHPVLGIPGPPGGAQLICQYYVKSALQLLMTGKTTPPTVVPAELADEISVKQIDFMQPVELFQEGGKIFARCLYPAGKSRAQNRSAFQKILYCPKGAGFQKGDMVPIEFPWL